MTRPRYNPLLPRRCVGTKPPVRLAAGGLLAWALLWFAPASVAAQTYQGRTDQNEPWSITINNDVVTSASVIVDEGCTPDQNLRRFHITDQNLAVKNSKFSDTYTNSVPGRSYKVSLSGTIVSGVIIGNVEDQETYSDGSSCFAADTYGTGHGTMGPFKLAYSIKPVPHHPRRGVLKKILLRGLPESATLTTYLSSPTLHHFATLTTVTIRTPRQITLQFRQRIVMVPGSQFLVGTKSFGKIERFKDYKFLPSAGSPGLRVKWQVCAPPTESAYQVAGFATGFPAIIVPCS
jgi:hypothetical protein